MPLHKHSNVARLYNVSTQDLNSSTPRRFFSSYIAGVGTRFDGKDETGDPGVGSYATAGAASAWGGEGRINWALLQLQNNLHFRYFKITLSAAMGVHDRDLVRRMSTDMQRSAQDVALLSKSKSAVIPGEQQDIVLRGTEHTIGKLGNILSEHFFSPDHAARRQVLAARNAELQKRLAIALQNKPTVLQIKLFVYGFSRGAAEARTFLHWLRDGYWDAARQELLLCGIPMKVEFVGLFDSVASVGIANSAHITDGHGGWAAPPSQRLPGYVGRCLHLVAAHEVRGSFPLDLCEGAEEVIYPGVHSDVGGGYLPGEQGKGHSDADKLSQVPLQHMYHAARRAGAPLDMHGAAERDQEAFNISDALWKRFNAYIDACSALQAGQAAGQPGGGDALALIHQQYKLYLRWRLARLQNLTSQGFFKRAKAQDQADLRYANQELELEIKQQTLHPSPSTLPLSHMAPALGNSEHDRKLAELFDEYVHDSRAWFKPFGDDDDVWLAKKKQEIRDLQKLEQQNRGGWFRSYPAAISLPDRERLRKHGELVRQADQIAQLPKPTAADKKKLAEINAALAEGLPTQNTGREPMLLGWGYLRWRSIFRNAELPLPQVKAVDLEQLRQEAKHKAKLHAILQDSLSGLYD